MKVLLMGTGGADGIPSFYGGTRVDQHARTYRGKDIRSRSAALIDDVLKIDLGPDTLSQIQNLGLDARHWTSLFITHSDDDHLCLSELQYAMFPFVEEIQLNYAIFGNTSVCKKISERYPKWPIETHCLAPFVQEEHLGYLVTPILANHSQDEMCFNFIFEKNGKKFLYATDTGYYSEETFAFLEGKQIHAMVVECSDGLHKTPYVGHMDIVQCVELVTRIRESKGLTLNAPVYTTHHTSNGDATHEELTQILAPYRIKPGHDGLTFEI
jgi:phosphoribosyl 1,2-cyclic phosphate phosphodiesterase